MCFLGTEVRLWKKLQTPRAPYKAHKAHKAHKETKRQTNKETKKHPAEDEDADADGGRSRPKAPAIPDLPRGATGSHARLRLSAPSHACARLSRLSRLLSDGVGVGGQPWFVEKEALARAPRNPLYTGSEPLDPRPSIWEAVEARGGSLRPGGGGGGYAFSSSPSVYGSTPGGHVRGPSTSTFFSHENGGEISKQAPNSAYTKNEQSTRPNVAALQHLISKRPLRERRARTTGAMARLRPPRVSFWTAPPPATRSPARETGAWATGGRRVLRYAMPATARGAYRAYCVSLRTVWEGQRAPAWCLVSSIFLATQVAVAIAIVRGGRAEAPCLDVRAPSSSPRHVWSPASGLNPTYPASRPSALCCAGPTGPHSQGAPFLAKRKSLFIFEFRNYAPNASRSVPRLRNRAIATSYGVWRVVPTAPMSHFPFSDLCAASHARNVPLANAVAPRTAARAQIVLQAQTPADAALLPSLVTRFGSRRALGRPRPLSRRTVRCALSAFRFPLSALHWGRPVWTTAPSAEATLDLVGFLCA
ncbi:hypothetical protein DFH11DRAFT_1733512 [Phellopilus nigrolimitatus]|nr:hypothetical protein DFH11DRAFT_1733512 [Phellopilus nigrolimitatus]